MLPLTIDITNSLMVEWIHKLNLVIKERSNDYKDASGKNPVIQYDDEAENLVSKKVNVLFYKEKKTGKGNTRMHDMLAPVMQEGEHLSYNAEEVETIKASVKKSLDAFISKQTTVNSEAPIEGEAPFATNTF